MAKHVFRLARHGSCYHEGEFVKETEKTVFYKKVSTMYRSGEQEGRMLKGWDCVVVETDNPDGVVARWDAIWKSHHEHVEEARAALTAATEERRNDAYRAAFMMEQV